MHEDKSSFGGIDLSADRSKMEVQGNAEDFQFNFDPAQLQGMNIDGFVPVIINVQLLKDLNLFFWD